MRYKLILALALTFVALAPLAAPVKPVEARTGPIVSIDCIGLAYDQLRCTTEVYGGTAPYTYAWGPSPITGSGQSLRIGCSGISRTISVTVTDANGETDTYSDLFYCQ